MLETQCHFHILDSNIMDSGVNRPKISRYRSGISMSVFKILLDLLFFYLLRTFFQLSFFT